MNGIIHEVVFKFDDGDYTVRQDGVGDTVFGPTAHKIMFAMDRHERAHNQASIYKLRMSGKIKFITDRSEYIAQNPDKP